MLHFQISHYLYYVFQVDYLHSLNSLHCLHQQQKIILIFASRCPATRVSSRCPATRRDSANTGHAGMSRPAGHCRSYPVTSGCHGLTHSESWGPGLPAASTPLAAQWRGGGGSRPRGQDQVAETVAGVCGGPGISPRSEAVAGDSLMGGGWFGLGKRSAVGGMLPGPALFAGEALCRNHKGMMVAYAGRGSRLPTARPSATRESRDSGSPAVLFVSSRHACELDVSPPIQVEPGG